MSSERSSRGRGRERLGACSAPRMRRRRVVQTIGGCGLAWALPGVVLAAPDPANELGSGRYATLRVFLEKTVLQIDVLKLEIRVDQATADELERAIRGREYSSDLERKVVAIVLGTGDASSSLNFLRSFSREAFIDGVREDVTRAYEGKLIDRREYQRVYRGLPSWFAFLGERGVKAGDWLLHRGTSAGLRSVFTDDRGNKLMDRTFSGAQPTRTLLASFLAPGGDLREPLARSLFP